MGSDKDRKKKKKDENEIKKRKNRDKSKKSSSKRSSDDDAKHDNIKDYSDDDYKRSKRSSDRGRDRVETKKHSSSKSRHYDRMKHKRRRNEDKMYEEDDRKKKHSSSSRKKRKEKDLRRDENVDDDLGKVRGVKPDALLDPDTSYFQYHDHLRLYLFKSRGISFEDLSSDETRRYFQKFCDAYNAGKLEELYYLGELPEGIMKQVKRTNYSWGVKMSENDRRTLEYVRNGVKKQTEWSDGRKDGLEKGEAVEDKRFCVKVPEKNDSEDAEEKLKQKLQRKRQNRNLRDRVRVAQEEMTGIGEKKYGREKQIEQKRQQAFKQHSAANQKEEFTAGVEVQDSDIYGGSDFNAAVRREKYYKELHKKKKDARIQELQQKEAEKRQNMLKQLGLDNVAPGSKIVIAPRNDGA